LGRLRAKGMVPPNDGRGRQRLMSSNASAGRRRRGDQGPAAPSPGRVLVARATRRKLCAACVARLEPPSPRAGEKPLDDVRRERMARGTARGYEQVVALGGLGHGVGVDAEDVCSHQGLRHSPPAGGLGERPFLVGRRTRQWRRPRQPRWQGGQKWRSGGEAAVAIGGAGRGPPVKRSLVSAPRRAPLCRQRCGGRSSARRTRRRSRPEAGSFSSPARGRSHFGPHRDREATPVRPTL